MLNGGQKGSRRKSEWEWQYLDRSKKMPTSPLPSDLSRTASTAKKFTRILTNNLFHSLTDSLNPKEPDSQFLCPDQENGTDFAKAHCERDVGDTIKLGTEIGRPRRKSVALEWRRKLKLHKLFGDKDPLSVSQEHSRGPRLLSRSPKVTNHHDAGAPDRSSPLLKAFLSPSVSASESDSEYELELKDIRRRQTSTNKLRQFFGEPRYKVPVQNAKVMQYRKKRKPLTPSSLFSTISEPMLRKPHSRGEWCGGNTSQPNTSRIITTSPGCHCSLATDCSHISHNCSSIDHNPSSLSQMSPPTVANIADLTSPPVSPKSASSGNTDIILGYADQSGGADIILYYANQSGNNMKDPNQAKPDSEMVNHMDSLLDELEDMLRYNKGTDICQGSSIERNNGSPREIQTITGEPEQLLMNIVGARSRSKTNSFVEAFKGNSVASSPDLIPSPSEDLTMKKRDLTVSCWPLALHVTCFPREPDFLIVLRFDNNNPSCTSV